MPIIHRNKGANIGLIAWSSNYLLWNYRARQEMSTRGAVHILRSHSSSQWLLLPTRQVAGRSRTFSATGHRVALAAQRLALVFRPQCLACQSKAVLAWQVRKTEG